MPRLPALSVRQLWAAAIVLGVKDVENRDWRLPAPFVGVPVLIHAGKTMDCPRSQLQRAAGPDASMLLERLNASPDASRTGGIVGVAIFDGCDFDGSRSRWAEPGLYHWRIREARPLPFFACRG